MLTLFKQQYTTRIKLRRDAICTEKDGTDLFREYNNAVQYELQELRSGSPEEYAELERAAEALRGEIIRALKDWEIRTGARIYIMCVWTGPNGAPAGFE